MCSFSYLEQSNPEQFAGEFNSAINSTILQALDKVFPIFNTPPLDPDVFDPPTKKVPGADKFLTHLSLANKASSILTNTLRSGGNEIPYEALIFLTSLNETCCSGIHKIPLQATAHTALEFVNKTRKFIHSNIKKLKAKHKKNNIKANLQKKFERIKENPQQIFSLYKSFIKNKIQVLSKIINGKIHILFENDMIVEITNNWKKIFTSTAPRVLLDKFFLNMPKIKDNYSLPNPDFSVHNLRRIIKSKKNTAPGESKISWKCLKNAPDSLLAMLSELYSHSYNNNTLPKDWYKGQTVLIEKPTDDIGLDKYRPITLLSVEYKLFSHVLTDTLVQILKDNDLIPISQNGFFPDRGSDQCIHSLINIIGNAKQFHKELHVLYLDLAKAFDSVEHWVIEDILDHIGAGYLGKVIISTLLHSTTQIETGAGWTEAIKFDRGTKQGDIISPVIFALFTAPLLWTLQNSKLGYEISSTLISSLAIADDLALTAPSHNNISKLFHITKDYFDKVGMVINPKKSAAAYRSDNPFIPTVNGTPFKDLDSKLSYKYLGIYINLELDWGIQLDTCVTTYKAAVNILLKKFYLTCNQHIKLINSIAIAALAYRMQFIILPVDVASLLLNWTIHNIAKTHSIPHLHINTYFWTNYKGLINLRNLNLAIYSSNIHKNLNKISLVAYPILAKCVAPQLNCAPHRPIIHHLAVPQDIIDMHINLKIDFINVDNIKRIARIFPPSCIPTQDHWDHLSKLYCANINRSILAQPPIKPIPIENPPFSVTAFVDGSCCLRSYIMTTALLHSANNDSFTCNVQGPLNSLEPELVGIEIIITLLANCSLVFIFTDSLSAIKSIKKFNSLNTNGKLKNTNRATLSRIMSLINIHNFKICYEFGKHLPLIQGEKKIVFYHIHSHMLTNREKKIKHWDSHISKLGIFTPTAVHLNDVVDKLAQKTNSTPVSYAPRILSPGNDLWTAYNILEDSPIFPKLKNYIYDKLQERDLVQFIQADGEFAKRLFNPLVSRKFTLHIFKSKNISHSYLADFLHKLLEKSLPTRLRIYNTSKKQRYEIAISKNASLGSNKNKNDPATKLVKYNDCFCVWCAINEGKYIAEDTTHIFSECPAAIDTKKELVSQILEVINSQSIYISSLPTWFTCCIKHFPINETEREVMLFPKNLGDTGYFPLAVVKWIKELGLTKYKKIAKKLNFILIKHLHGLWVHRCEYFHKYALKVEEMSQKTDTEIQENVDI